MRLSILFVTRNRKDELLRAMRSCVLHGVEDMEFVIVDNNSNDGTREYIEEYLTLVNVKHKYYYANKNLGVAGGRNKAFALAEGEYAFSLDDDAVVETSGFFQELCDRMDENPEVVAAAVEIYEPHSNRFLKGKVYSMSKGYEGLRVFSFFGGAHILRRSFYCHGNGLYPDRLVFGSEELYPSLVAHKADRVIAYFDDLRVLHLPRVDTQANEQERALNIILNTHLIRKLVYPKITHPILDVLLMARIARHRLNKYKSYRQISELLHERYDPINVSRMRIGTLVKLACSVGIKHLF